MQIEEPIPLEPQPEAGSRFIHLTGDVGEETISPVIEKLFRMAEESPVLPINLVISTYGGVVHDALALFDAMKFCPAPIRTIGLGKIMSAGCLILAAGTAGERRIGKNCTLMYHGPQSGMYGDMFDVETRLAEFRRLQHLYDQLVSEATGRPIERVRELYLPERKEHYMTAEAAVKFGFADRLF